MKNTNFSVTDLTTLLASIQPNGAEMKSLPSIKGNRLRSKTYYIAGLTSAMNAGDTVLPSTVKDPGITNFSNAKLPADTYFLVTGIRVLFDTTVTDPKVALWANVAPPAWKNGELIIGQDGQPSLFEAPVTDVTNFKASTGNDDDFRDVAGFLLQPNKVISIKALLAGTPAATVYKIELRGYEVFKA